MSKADIMAKALLNSMNVQFEKGKIDEPMEVGIVTNLNPLIIEVQSLPLYINNLYINKYLLDWEEVVNITTSSDGEYGHTHTISTINHPTKLSIGCHVGLYGVEWNEVGKSYQRYHVMYVIE